MIIHAQTLFHNLALLSLTFLDKNVCSIDFTTTYYGGEGMYQNIVVAQQTDQGFLFVFDVYYYFY